MRILVVEDNLEISHYLAKGLRQESFAVDTVADGKAGLNAALSYDYDLIITDLNLPEIKGDELVARIRQEGKTVPVIVLTVEEGVATKVDLLAHCDDYMTKPFSFQELSARIRAILRRGSVLTSDVLKIDDLIVDVRSFKVERAGKEIRLRNKEFSLLEFMMRNAGSVLTRTEILEKVWDMNVDPLTNTVDVHINHLREKIDVGFKRKLLQTVPGRGYKLEL